MLALSSSPAWNNLPKSQGLEIKDWIDNCTVRHADILAAVREKKEIQQIPKVDRHPKFEVPDLRPWTPTLTNC